MSKLINDPIYGFIDLPQGIIARLLEHRYYQRLRRICQLGTAQYVYPNATHSRFTHTLGALHLMQSAVAVLRKKEVEISAEEEEAVLIAILLHDLGHSPFSHSLEGSLLRVHHEEISVALMEALNAEDGSLHGALTLALAIFKDEYKKRFLHQLVSGQIDMDRLDYLTRDSYFTGVAEGNVGYKRILETLQVVNNELVVDFKGIYSIENFLISRRLMYWQVYLHKAVVASAAMLRHAFGRARQLLARGEVLPSGCSSSLLFFLQKWPNSADLLAERADLLAHFVALDDSDVWQALKAWATSSDVVLSILAKGLLERRLLAVASEDSSVGEEKIKLLRQQWAEQLNISVEDAAFLVFEQKETNQAYNSRKQTIKILKHDGTVRPISDWKEHNIQPKVVEKYYLCAPK